METFPIPQYFIQRNNNGNSGKLQHETAPTFAKKIHFMWYYFIFRMTISIRSEEENYIWKYLRAPEL